MVEKRMKIKGLIGETFAGMSSPNDDNNRQFLWDELVGIMSLWEMPWCIGGDLNAIRFPSERVGVTRYSSPMGEFSSFISDQGLMDIPLMGGQYTWSNNHCWSRIDRFLFSPRWKRSFLIWFRGDFLVYCLIIFLFYLTVE